MNEEMSKKKKKCVAPCGGPNTQWLNYVSHMDYGHASLFHFTA